MNPIDPYPEEHFRGEAVAELLDRNRVASEAHRRGRVGPPSREEVRLELERMALYRLRGPVPNWKHAEHLSAGIVGRVEAVAALRREAFSARLPSNRRRIEV